MSYLESEIDDIQKKTVYEVEKLQVEIFTELKNRAITNKNKLPEECREAYIQGFCRAIDSIIDIINTDINQQDILEQKTADRKSLP